MPASMLLSSQVNNKREAVLYYDSLDFDVSKIMILPDKTPAKNINPVRVAFPENKDYTNNSRGGHNP